MTVSEACGKPDTMPSPIPPRSDVQYQRTAPAAEALHAALLHAHAAYDTPADEEQAEWLATLAREAAAELNLTAFWTTKNPRTGDPGPGATAEREPFAARAEMYRINLMRQFRSRWHLDPHEPIRH